MTPTGGARSASHAHTRRNEHTHRSCTADERLFMRDGAAHAVDTGL